MRACSFSSSKRPSVTASLSQTLVWLTMKSLVSLNRARTALATLRNFPIPHSRSGDRPKPPARSATNGPNRALKFAPSGRWDALSSRLLLLGL